MRSLLCLLAAFLVAVGSADGSDRDQRWVTRHYSSTDGLPVGSARASQVDAEGFLWVATHDGLARFDGRQFDIYDAPRVPGMNSNRIAHLFRHDSGRLFALTISGELLDIHNSQIRRLQLDPARGMDPVRFLDPQSLCATVVTGMYCPDEAGDYRLRIPIDIELGIAAAVPISTLDAWLIAPGRGIYLQTGQRRQLIFDRPDLQLHPASFPNALVSRDQALLVDLEPGLLQLRIDGSAYWPHLRSEGALDLLRVHRDHDDSIRLDASQGLFELDGTGLREFRTPRQIERQPHMLSWRAPDGALWFSDGGTLFREQDPVLISRGRIEHVNFDLDEIVWISTHRDGLYALSLPRIEVLGSEFGLSEDNVYGLAYGGDGEVWVGSLGGGVMRIGSDDRVEQFGPSEGLTAPYTWVVAMAADASVYVAPYGPGLYRRPPGTRVFEPVDLPAALGQAQILALAIDEAQRMWVGSSHGVWYLDGLEWRPVDLPDRATTVRSILFARDGSIWFGTHQGLWRRQGSEVETIARHLLDGVIVRHLYQARDDSIWASTEGFGLLRVDASDPDGAQAMLFGRRLGLPSNSPHAVREDGDGNLWVNSNQGVFRLLAQNLADVFAGRSEYLTPLSIGLADGLDELEGNGGVEPAAVVDGGGRLWFPSQRGIIRIDPSRIRLRTTPPVPVIDHIEIDGHPLPSNQRTTLPLGQRSLSVHYNAADLHAGSELRFRHRLLPLQRNWIEAGDRRAASYLALAPGQYRFELAAANSDGYWNPTATAIEFTVPEHWHETRSFQLAGLSLLALLVAWLITHRVRRLHRLAVELDSQVEERTHELRLAKERAETTLAELAVANSSLEAKNQTIESSNRKLADQARRLEALDGFRARLLADIGHELRTPLMLIGMPLRELAEHAKGLNEGELRHLELSLRQTERLSALVEQLIDLVQAEAGQLRLSARVIDLHAFLNGLAADYTPIAVDRGVCLRVDSPSTHPRLFADQVKLATALGNLIDNALKFAPAGSEVQVRARIDEDREQVLIEVQDAGPGFDAANASQLFERFYRGEGNSAGGRRGLGIGLALARELIELHGGQIGARSAPGAGACFWMRLPTGTAHLGGDELDACTTTSLAVLAAKLPMAGDGQGQGPGGRILLVEDDPDLSHYLAERLVEYAQVELAPDAESALKLLAQAHYDLVISDVMLPAADGLELCSQIKAHPDLRALPVLLASARSTEQDREQALNAGADAFLSKPFDFDTLLATIARIWPQAQALIDSHDIHAGDAPIDTLLAPAMAGLADAGFDLGTWAEQCHLSERQLRRRVHELTGLSPVAWLREQRLQRVRRLISSGECRTLAEAGLQAGIDNPGYLYRLYRTRFGEIDT